MTPLDLALGFLALLFLGLWVVSEMQRYDATQKLRDAKAQAAFVAAFVNALPPDAVCSSPRTFYTKHDYRGSKWCRRCAIENHRYVAPLVDVPFTSAEGATVGLVLEDDSLSADATLIASTSRIASVAPVKATEGELDRLRGCGRESSLYRTGRNRRFANIGDGG